MAYQFLGFPTFLARVGKSYSQQARTRAQRNASLIDLGRVLAQACGCSPPSQLQVMDQARVRLEGMRLALEASEAMFAEVEAALFPVATEPPPETETEEFLPSNGHVNKRKVRA